MYQRILVPIDGSPTSNRGLEEAIRLAKSSGSVIGLLHVLDELIYLADYGTGIPYSSQVLPVLRQGAERILAEGQARVAAAGVPVDTLLVEGFGSRTAELVQAQAKAWNADLMVLGTHGRRGVGRVLLGSDAEQIVRTARIPVLLVPAAEERAEAPQADVVETAIAAAARVATATI